MTNRFFFVVIGLFFALNVPNIVGGQDQQAPPQRAKNGLLVLYDFAAAKGNVVRDRSGNGQALDLKISQPKAVRRRSGSLTVHSQTVIASDGPATKIIDAVKLTNELSIEAWVQPANTDQEGPVRIVTLSKDTGERNFTLGQQRDAYDVRLRTTKTSTNGIPSISTPPKNVTTELTHVVYARSRSGQTRLYVNGREVSRGDVSGSTDNWDNSVRLAIGSEFSTDERLWLGTFHLVAVYGLALTADEVQLNLAAGVDGQFASSPAVAEAKSRAEERVTKGLQVLYNFADASGPLVKDRAGTGRPVDLRITDLEAVRRSVGSLEIRGKTLIRSEGKASRRVIEAIRGSKSATIEAWLHPANTDQLGPARIVTLSKNSNERNLTLGQDGDRFEVRFRTTRTSGNGIPSLSSPRRSLAAKLMHVVYTRSRNGQARLYIDGKRSEQAKVDGDTSNWDRSLQLALGNELSQDRPWLGKYHLVAIYNRDLSESEVRQNHRAGAIVAGTLTQFASHRPDPRAQHFEIHVAPLLAKHCLECHDSSSHHGGLDLSRNATLLTGGETGPALVAGKHAESLLWEAVESDTMPQDRPPLTSDEKAHLRQWIDGGAVWSLDMIDPVVYLNDGDGRTWIRRLTVAEYIATVRAAVGVDIATEARRLLPPDLRADGFSNTAYNLNVDLKHIEAYGQLAEIIVGRIDSVAFARRFSRSQKFTDDDMGKLVSRMGKWLLRGPLDQDELITYRGISTTVVASGGDFKDAVRYMVLAMLQSPRFIYRVESQRGDGSSWPAGQYELASRLSFILWGCSPDEELMKAADDGRLDREGSRQQVDRMLKDPRAIERSLQFATEWLNLNRLDNLQPSRRKFPNWDHQLASDMRRETLAFFEDVTWQQRRPLGDLLNAQVTFVTPRLAAHYGLKSQPVGDDKRDTELTRYDLSRDPGRGGLLTHGSVLTIGGDEASMVTRGLFVMHDLLRGVVRDPPPCVDTTPVPTKSGLTQRNIAEARIANESCGGCHAKFEPLAFGLEKFDGLGTYHDDDEHGNTLREDGEVLIPGQSQPASYKSASELMDLLARSPRVQESLTWKLTQFAIGRPLIAADARIIAKIHKNAMEGGGTYQALMFEIVLSDLVQLTRTEVDE